MLLAIQMVIASKHLVMFASVVQDLLMLLQYFYLAWHLISLEL